ncbi:hypothetical protein BV22DRAFT_986845, partial [Leucogyrophana mollusca]
IEQTPDVTLAELQKALREVCNVGVSSATISRTLRRRGFSCKKVNRPALERNEDCRAAYKIHIGSNYNAQQLVFVDEIHLN